MRADIIETTGEIVPSSSGGLISLAGTLDEIVAFQKAYQEVCRKLLDENDIQVIGKKEFKKRSAWNKLSVAFGVSTEEVRTSHERDERGRIIRTECVVKATAPNGRTSDGIGACDLYERCCEAETCRTPTHWPDGNVRHKHCSGFPCKEPHFSNPQHDIPATAFTRASNRAKADLFGMGEVSAEEMTDHGDSAPTTHTTTPNANPTHRKNASQGQIDYLASLLPKNNTTLLELKEIIGREVTESSDLTLAEARSVIDHLKAGAA